MILAAKSGLVSDDSSTSEEVWAESSASASKVSSILSEGMVSSWVATIGVVAIGRNEGERLKRCLESLSALSDRTVYVDSGSTDGSVLTSRLSGVSVLELDLATPFTAARARNEGFRQLLDAYPRLEYVFFVDGDCEVMPGWLETAVGFLNSHRDVAAVWGRRRERYPDKTVYNMLCDLEWQESAYGETRACGGDAVMRVSAFRRAQGYRPDLICGEEPELCLRMRRAGWRIWRIPQDMTLHDVAIDRFSQWWNRSVRSGYGFAQGRSLHGDSPERHWVTESRRAWIWGLWIPAVILLLAVGVKWWCLSLFAVYPLQVLRIALMGKFSARQNWWRAVGLVSSKVPEVLGQVRFLRDRSMRHQARLIEYK